jgi:hypothetical protein
MLIHDWSCYEGLNQSLDMADRQQSNGHSFTLAISHHMVSLKQGDKEVFSMAVSGQPKEVTLSINDVPGVAVSNRTLNINGKSQAMLSVLINK